MKHTKKSIKKPATPKVIKGVPIKSKTYAKKTKKAK